MVAKIKSGKSLKGALFYNEQKVANGNAVLLDAVGYANDTAQLSISDKLFRLQDLAERNQRVTTNTVHISLNFGLKENLPGQQLLEITGKYMEGIGFEGQPYLVYQHYDAGHPHIHILTTNIDRDGKRISLHDLGRTKSETSRRSIENEFGLQKAEEQKVNEKLIIEPIKYGKVDSKRAIEAVVNSVTGRYLFTSLPELNAALQQFNVVADRGSKNSVMYKQNGLRYWITSSKGEKLGTPVKASALKGKPTLKLLSRRFTLNETLRRPQKEKVRSKIDKSFAQAETVKQFQAALAKMDILAVIRRTDKGLIYGMTFVDNGLKTVFNGSDLGKGYAAAAVAGRLNDTPGSYKQQQKNDGQHEPGALNSTLKQETILEALLAATGDDPMIAAELRRKRKKKRRLNL